MTDKTKREYPAMVYSKDASTIVQSEEHLAALKGKWYDSPADVPEMKDKADPVTGAVPAAPFNAADAGSGDLPAPIGRDATERDRLEYQATDIGLKVDKRWTNETLRRAILEHASA